MALSVADDAVATLRPKDGHTSVKGVTINLVERSNFKIKHVIFLIIQ